VHDEALVPTARAQRLEDQNIVIHRARVPRQNGAVNVVVEVHEGKDETTVDVCTAPAKDDGDTTSVRQLSGFEVTRPSQNSIAAPEQTPQAIVLAPGGRVGKYELREKLGMGTFGLVFRAHDTDLDRDVALKVLNPTHISNRDVLLRFLQEARASARILHPGIVTVFDFGRVPTSFGDTAFITMELLGGESLTSRLNRSGRLSQETACEIARQVASALDAAHRADVLHRDLKPDNIYIVPDPAVPSGERVKVLDFGLAKLGRHGHTMMNTVFGTPRYMSPEQCRSSGQIDQRSDIYALGCILFELVTGRTPFDGDLRQLIERHQRATPPRARSFAPEISEALDDLIDSMLAKDPAVRPQTMGGLQRSLESLGAVAVGVATTLLPFPASLVALPAPGQPQPQLAAALLQQQAGAPMVGGSGPRPFAPSEAEILVPPRPPARERRPALMLPPEGRRSGRKRTVAIAAAVAFVVAALLTAIATREPALAGTSASQRPAATRTSGTP
jgi:hypothetical protein